MRSLKVIFLISACIFIGCAEKHYLTPDVPSIAVMNERLAERICKVTTREGSQVSVVYRRASLDSLEVIVRETDVSKTLPLKSIKSIEARDHVRGSGDGALLGVSTGAFVGTIVGGMIGSISGCSDCVDESPGFSRMLSLGAQVGLIGCLVGAVPGVFFGAIIGRPIEFQF